MKPLYPRVPRRPDLNEMVVDLIRRSTGEVVVHCAEDNRALGGRFDTPDGPLFYTEYIGPDLLGRSVRRMFDETHREPDRRIADCWLPGSEPPSPMGTKCGKCGKQRTWPLALVLEASPGAHIHVR